MGKVQVDVLFGGRDNCRVENIIFEVVDLDSPYYALLGRPTLAKFMGSTHMVYLKMKMSAPNGILTVVGNYKTSMHRNCLCRILLGRMSGHCGGDEKVENGCCTGTFCAAQHGRNDQHAWWGGFQAAKDTKDIVLDPEQLERTVRIGAGLSKKSKSALIDFLHENRNIFAWSTDDLKTDKFVWTPQADAAFRELKKMPAKTPVLASSLPKEPMLLYIAATNRVVSVVVVLEREEEGKNKCRDRYYYLSEVHSLSKKNYAHYQKMTCGVFMSAKKLKYYFEEHPMTVVCAAPISEIVGNKDASGRIAKWAIELAPYVPHYERGDAIKSQELADFLVGWAKMQYEPPKSDSNYWKIHFDDSKLKKGLGADVVLTSPKGDQLKYVLQIHFRASNNVAEYEALVHGFKVEKEVRVCQIICYGDAYLVVQPSSGDWDAKDANMASYRFHMQQVAGFFEVCEFHHVPRADNEAADTLSPLGSSRQAIRSNIAQLAHLRKPSIKPSPESESNFVPEANVVPMEIDQANPRTAPSNLGTSQSNSAKAMSVDNMEVDEPAFVVREVPSWVKPIMSDLVSSELPAEEVLARRIQRRAKSYTIINGEMYKRSVTGVQSYVEPEEGREILRDIHQGEYEYHASRALVAKAFRHGFY
ncbi:uncharacterized protein [Lolium perenne]|uniref:uncharacterized protein n=1 Tax=Lolium perenne TaxID=4522 RepID=UPI0021F626AD|nr:uncharacterized protein LOC127339453 [Lolium perenne]